MSDLNVHTLTDEELLELALLNGDNRYVPELAKRFRASKREVIAAEQAWRAVMGVLRAILRYLPDEAKNAVQEIIDQG